MNSSFVIRNVRVFDGMRRLPESSVWIEGGTIKALGSSFELPPGMATIDGSNRTLLPGLIDAHTHVASKEDLRTALIFGVTTELDMANDYKLVKTIKEDERQGKSTARADLRSAGTLVTAPYGHGTEYALQVPTITRPEEAEAFVAARIAEGSDYIKLICEDGSAYGISFPTLSQETMTAVVQAAKKAGKMTVAHISSLRGARDAITAGVDGLVHLFEDEPPDPLFAAFAADHQVFVIPTLTVLECTLGVRSGVSLLEDSRMSPYLTTENKSCLEMTFISFPGQRRLRFAYAQQAIRELKHAGVGLLAGTDASNPGTAHGASLHRELELLVQAGLTPVEALAAATSTPARVFHLDDRGLIAEGRRADLLLVQGDPTSDITATRDIVAVWKGGVELARADAAKQAQMEEDIGPSGSEAGLVSNFDDGTLSTHFGTGWIAVSDGIMGGGSRAEMKVIAGGANGGKGCLQVAGEIDPMLPHSWAGAAFYPGRGPFNPANLTSKKQIRFWARDENRRTYTLALHHWNHGMRRNSQVFATGPGWKEYSFPLREFQTDGRGVMGLMFLAGPTPGGFSFQIDDVRIE